MVYDIRDLRSMVRIAIDHNNSSQTLSGFGDIETLTLDQIIESKLIPAIRLTHMRAPASMLDGGKPFNAAVFWDDTDGDGSGRIHLPDDFMRLCSFRMSDWNRAVYHPIEPSDPRYKYQHCSYAGLRGTPQKPIVAIVSHPTGLMLEFYSCGKGSHATVTEARYLAEPRIRNNGIEICEKLLEPTIHYAAYLTALTIGETELAQSLLRITNSQLYFHSTPYIANGQQTESNS